MGPTLRKKSSNTPSIFATSFEKCEAYWKHMGLNFTYRGVKYIVDRYGISFGQLRAAQFFNGEKPYYCPEEAAQYLIEAALVSSKKFTACDTASIDEETDKIISDWMRHCGSLSILYVILIKQLEERHFFMSAAEMEMIANTTQLSNSLQTAASHLMKMTLISLTRQITNTGSILREMHTRNSGRMNK